MLQDYQVLYLDNDIPINRSFYCNNGDIKSRGLEVHVLDNSQAKDCTGLTLRMIVKVPSGEMFEATVANGLVTVLNATSGIFQILFPDNMGRGRLIAEIQLSNTVPEVIVSRKFSILGDGSLTSDGVISLTPQGGLLWNVLTNEVQRQADFDAIFADIEPAAAAKYEELEAQYATDLTIVKSQLAETQTQFQQVIANATVDSEVINARGGKVNLDTRLNDDKTEILGQLAEKANKAQEAWITPTLLNGYTAGSFGTPQYMIDNFGFVHFRGSLTGGTPGQKAFDIIAGYRPSNTKIWASTAGYNNFNTGFIATNGSFTPNRFGTTGDTGLDQICYKVGA